MKLPLLWKPKTFFMKIFNSYINRKILRKVKTTTTTTTTTKFHLLKSYLERFGKKGGQYNLLCKTGSKFLLINRDSH